LIAAPAHQDSWMADENPEFCIHSKNDSSIDLIS
jgi:hypothetical protein